MNNSSIYDFHISDLRDKNISGKNNTEVNKLFFQVIISYLKDNMKILDIGTGNGYVLKVISEETTKKIHLYGNDNSEAMLKKAKENCNNATFNLCSNYNLKYENNFFDMVVGKNVTRFSAKEINRVLKPEGLFIFREYGKYKGMMEISKIFKDRLIRSRYKSYYDNKMKSNGFIIINSKYVIEKRIFPNVDAIIGVIESFPMIKEFNKEDENILREIYIESSDINVTSDGFVAVYQKKKVR